MQMTYSLARITAHSMRRKERAWQRWSGRVRGEFGGVREISSGGEMSIWWATEERKRWGRNES